MKNYLTITLMLLTCTVLSAQNDSLPSFYITINGQPASSLEFEQASRDSTAIMHFLPPEKAVALFGPLAKRGAILVTTSRPEAEYEEPVILMNGRRIDPGNVPGDSVWRIHVIRGRQAVNLYGPAGRRGIHIIQDDKTHFDKLVPELKNMVIHVTNSKGRAIKNAEVLNENGSILARTDACGWAILENFSIGKSVTISVGKKSLQNLVLTDQVTNIKL